MRYEAHDDYLFLRYDSVNPQDVLLSFSSLLCKAKENRVEKCVIVFRYPSETESNERQKYSDINQFFFIFINCSSQKKVENLLYSIGFAICLKQLKEFQCQRML
ncbi:CLUMA_CG001142, isoform A [Clunio marinus]|uniref:CLUMA_CG001142, isoform A n=1 Tax=Clunio marinus TaxID=568069 RepID=A0A1J1HIW2_9DIPT|nr:CLUMA_CG001142, isoform A [Clunio marinus]